MDPTINPFAPGAGSPPPEFAGRRALIDDCKTALARVKAGRPARGVILTGLRGVGKTVLLNVIFKHAIDLKFQVDLLEAPEGTPLAQQLVPSLRQMLVRLSVKAKAADIVHKALRVLKSFQVTTKLPGVDFDLTLSPEPGTADSGLFDRDLADLLVSVGEAAQAEGTCVAILIDEVQYLDRGDLGALIVAVHRVTQRQLPVIVIGAGLPSLPGLSGEAKSYAERLFRYPVIGALEKPDASKALSEPVETLSVSFEPVALDMIFEITRGYPYFLQEWGSAVWDTAAGPVITAQDVRNVGPEATRRLDESFFRVRLDRVTETEQRYLRAMAELGPGSFKTGDIAQRLGKTTSAFGLTREGLIRKGMIYSPGHGMLDFTVPLFDQFLRRMMPDF